jgi:hypothetical protein
MSFNSNFKENSEIPEVQDVMGKKQAAKPYSPDWRTAIIDKLREGKEQRALNPEPKPKSMKDMLDPNKRPGMEGL